MGYDIFISYRRDGGEYTAKILRDHLQEAGYRAFFDVESLRSGDFNTKLYSVIDECTDFLLILSPGALDRCENDDDWVRREVEYALERGKNIVPIMLRSFTFPDKLPPSLEPLRYRNGLEANSQFFDAFLQQLKSKFLLTKPPMWRQVSQSSLLHRMLPVLLALVLLLGVGLGVRALVAGRSAVYPFSAAEKNLTGELLYIAGNNLINLDLTGSALNDAINAAQRHLSSGAEDDQALQNHFALARQTMENIDADAGVFPESSLERLASSPFNTADVGAMHDTVLRFQTECLDDLERIQWMMGPDCHMTSTDKLEILACYQTILSESLLGYGYACNDMLLPITSEEAMEDFWYETLPLLTLLPLRGADWQEDEAVLGSLLDQCFARKEKALLDLVSLGGHTAMDNAITAAENAKLEEALIAEYMAQGYSREEAKELIALMSELRATCLPQPGDDANLLWTKMQILLSHRLYDDALACVDACAALPPEATYAPRCIDSLRAFVDCCRTYGLFYGVMVMAYTEEGENELLELGDVIVSVDGQACVSYEAYTELRAQCPEVYTVQILRMTEAGDMGVVELELSKSMPPVYLNTVVDPPA